MLDKRTYADRSEYIKQAVAKRRKKIRRLACEFKGGKCAICGYNRSVEALEFHHLDPLSKDFGISAEGLTRSWDRVRAEIEKCVLICSNCHRELHAGITQLPKETLE